MTATVSATRTPSSNAFGAANNHGAAADTAGVSTAIDQRMKGSTDAAEPAIAPPPNAIDSTIETHAAASARPARLERALHAARARGARHPGDRNDDGLARRVCRGAHVSAPRTAGNTSGSRPRPRCLTQ